MAAWVTAISGLVIAVLAASLAYWNAQRLGQRQARLDRVNRQLEELYGPMLALAESSSTSWSVFRSRYRPHDRYFFEPGVELTVEEKNAWVAWMTSVFMPSNRSIQQLIVSKTHLLDDDDMPQPLLLFVAHVAGYEVVMDAWSRNDYSRLTSLINHPGDAFNAYLRTSFSRLKQRQQELLGGASKQSN